MNDLPCRILLCYPGGELLLFSYKKWMPISTISTKMSVLATQFFPSWEWSVDGDIPAIWDMENNRSILAVTGPQGEEPFL